MQTTTKNTVKIICVFLFIKVNLYVTLTRLMCLMSKANVHQKHSTAIVTTCKFGEALWRLLKDNQIIAHPIQFVDSFVEICGFFYSESAVLRVVLYVNMIFLSLIYCLVWYSKQVLWTLPNEDSVHRSRLRGNKF